MTLELAERIADLLAKRDILLTARNKAVGNPRLHRLFDQAMNKVNNAILKHLDA